MKHTEMIRRKGFFYEINKNKILFLMLLPTLLFFFINSYLPMIGIYYAFTKYDFAGGLFGSPFVGLQNFDFLYKSGLLVKLTLNTIGYNLVFIIFGNLLAIFCAILLSEVKSKYFKKITQSIMFLPFFVSFVILNVINYNIFNYDRGFLNSMLKIFGAGPVDVLNTPWVWVILIPIFY